MLLGPQLLLQAGVVMATATLTPHDRADSFTALWLALDPADAQARFAAAMGVLALVDEELAAAREFVDGAVERALTEASTKSEATR